MITGSRPSAKPCPLPVRQLHEAQLAAKARYPIVTAATPKRATAFDMAGQRDDGARTAAVLARLVSTSSAARTSPASRRLSARRRRSATVWSRRDQSRTARSVITTLGEVSAYSWRSFAP